MSKKIVLITGATDGIGKITARELAEKDFHIIVHGRNKEKAQNVVTEIKNETGNKDVDYLLADLFSLQAVKNMADDFTEKYDHLDVLINNAGAVLDDQIVETKDGLERTFALNVAAPFLLNQLLLPSLKKSSDGRIIDMSSATHTRANPDMNDINSFNNKSGQSRYGISKLFVIWNSTHLANKLKKEGIRNVTVNASHPGAVATNFGQDSDNGFFNNLIYKVALRFMPDPKEGAVTNVYLASSNEVKGVSGEFFDNKKQKEEPETKNHTPEKEQQLWDYCIKVSEPYLKNID